MVDSQNNSDALTNEGQLREIVDEHPYYALAQLDLLKSFESNRTPAFHQQAAKTALFFSNTYWLSWQLHPEADDDEIVTENKMADRIEQPANSRVESEVTNLSDKSNHEVYQEPVHEIRIEKDEEPVENTPVNILPVFNQDSGIPEPKEIRNEDTKSSETAVPDSSIKMENTEGNASEVEEIAFEPLHTVDYFASQGIKITEEPMSNDKLGKQMKSFTEWLKSMKKIHATKLPQGDDHTDRRIQNIAAESNSEADVVTEAMAEVYQKQGKTGRALEVYSKLSLIFPAKSAYFAAKIESLKAN